MAEEEKQAPPAAEMQLTHRQSFFDRSIWVRVVIAALFTVCLLAFLHFRQVRLEVLELGSTAKEYVVAQVDFAFPDDEATVLLRQEAVRDIGKFYRLNGKEISTRQSTFDQSLAGNDSWRKKVKNVTFDELYRGADTFATVLKRAHFVNARSLKKMEKIALPTMNAFVYTPADPKTPETIPTDVWNEIARRAFAQSELPEDAQQMIVAYFSEGEWSLFEDRAAAQQVRGQVESSVPRVHTLVSAGDRMVDRGETVGPRHVAMITSMNKLLQERRNLWHPMTLLGSLIITLLFVAIAAAYLRMYLPKIFYSNKRLLLLTTILVLTLAIAKGAELLLIKSTGLMDLVHYPLFVPFAAIILCSLLNARVAAFASAFLAIILSLTLAVDGGGFLVINLLAALVAILSTRSLRRRKEVFVVCAKAWVCCVAILLAYHFYDSTIFTLVFVSDLVTTMIFMLLTAVLVVGLLPLFESLFRIVTEITLMEFMDPTHPVLRRLSIEAPGTYQHSIVVGNIAEAAALEIGANGLFCRVATLYHDIGKLVSPQYFTENVGGGVNIHQLLTPLESAQVIMAHVPEGVAIARKAGLPEAFVDIIQQHHGTTLVYFFYHKQVELMGGDPANVNEEEFRYKGPKPRTKEAAIIMISDTLEAASRSLEDPNEENLLALVNKLIQQKIDDGQFERCLLTFEDLEKVKRSIVTSLVAASHTRIKYPERMAPAGPGDDPLMPPEEQT